MGTPVPHVSLPNPGPAQRAVTVTGAKRANQPIRVGDGPDWVPGATTISPLKRLTAPRLHERLRRVAQPDEVAELIAVLASARVSYVTGAVIAADGGRTAV